VPPSRAFVVIIVSAPSLPLLQGSDDDELPDTSPIFGSTVRHLHLWPRHGKVQISIRGGVSKYPRVKMRMGTCGKKFWVKIVEVASLDD
jgi:hypothetical protein